MTKNMFRILVFTALISLAFIMPTEARIEYINWTNPTRRNYYDSYYGASVTAYDQGTTAILIVNIYNTEGIDAFFTVKVKMDWAAENATSTETDYKIAHGESHIFEVKINIPDTVPNRYRHVYTVFSLYREALGDPLLLDERRTYSDFVVYSPEQSEANLLKTELDAYPSYFFTPFFSSSKARELTINASVHESMGVRSYERGDFVGARDHYRAALNYTEEAYASDTEYLSNFEDALVALINASQGYLTFQGWGFFVASLSFLLMGIGVIVYLVRKSRPPAS